LKANKSRIILSTKKIYLVRHGQTEFNKKGIVQGSAVNSSLNDTGRAQAHAFYQAYKHIPFDAVYTSALNRSIESVQAFIDQSIPHFIRPGLNEISWGEMGSWQQVPNTMNIKTFCCAGNKEMLNSRCGVVKVR
jgi:broad specificity phosphatase PhoE